MDRKYPRVNNSESPKRNGQEWPTVYYGLHMVPGVAEYADGPGGKPYRVLISNDVAKQMDASFEGRPVYVEHVDDEKLNVPNKTIDGETSKDGNKETKAADGYVIESFFNPPDGMHWAKFLVISREGHEAISRGWQLSNCYQPVNLGPGGEWHGVEYVKEFTAAEYKHLAIVPNPRYKESRILTPEQFKAYNKDKIDELAAMKNSADKTPKENGAMKIFNMFFPKKDKVEKVENTEQIKKTLVNMGNGRMVTLGQLIKNAAKMNDEDYDKMMVEEADRPEHNDDDEDDKDENPFAKKNRKKSSAFDDEHRDNDDDDDDDAKNDDDEDEELEAKKNRKKNRKRSDDGDVEELKGKKNRKHSDDGDELENGEFDGRGTDGERDFVGNKRNRKKSDAGDAELENDGLGEDPLKHVIMLDGEETTVGDMINAHMDLKNKYHNLRNKHNDLREEYSGLRAKYGDDDDCMNDEEIPERDADMQEVLGRLEDEEGNLEESLERRKNAIARVIGRMKNSTDAVAKREAKKQEGLEHMKRLQNAELSRMMDAEGTPVSTETSMSMVDRGRQRYGSAKN